MRAGRGIGVFCGDETIEQPRRYYVKNKNGEILGHVMTDANDVVEFRAQLNEIRNDPHHQRNRVCTVAQTLDELFPGEEDEA